MKDHTATSTAWVCPACDRRVPGHVEECRCGYSRAPAAEEAPAAGRDGDTAVLGATGVIALAAVVGGGLWIASRYLPSAAAPLLPQVAGRSAPGTTSRPTKRGDIPLPTLPAPSTDLAAIPLLDADRPQPSDMPLEDVVSRAMPAVVMVATPKTRGSGFFVKPDLVVTNVHVVAGFMFVEVTTAESQKMNGRVALLNDDLDIALVQVPRLGPSDATLTLGDSSRLRLGQGVVALGWAQSLSQSTLTRGVVTGLRQHDQQTLVQTDAVPHPGDSGGPLLDRDGRVVGVTTLRADNNSAGFAVAIDDVRPLVEQIRTNVMMVPLKGPGASAVVAPRPSDADLQRQAGISRYAQALSVAARHAADLDEYWLRYRAACGITVVPQGLTHEWYALYDPQSPLHRAPRHCESVLLEIQSRADQLTTDMQAADEAARRADVYPGTRRDLRQRYRLDYAGWDR